MTRTLEELGQTITNQLVFDEDGEIPTDNLLLAGEAVVEARREHFITNKGTPDYRGATYAYRVWFGDAIRASGLSHEEARKAMASIRYHAGNVMREVVPADELEDAGLKKESPRKRGQQQHESYSKLVSVFGAGTRIDDPDDVRLGLMSIQRFVRRTDWDAVKEHPDIKLMLRELKKRLP